MELSVSKNENGVVSIGESIESRKFQVSVDSQLFMVLSAQIYSDRIMAPIRELCCNAYDSHIAAGTDRKIDVCVPTSSNAIFSVRDYGVGLSKDDVFNLYSSYGKSTKRDSNDQIGCLGLGSKSPLAYTDSYSVVSFFDGMRYEYVVQLKNGEPYCDLLQEGETDEPNGLLVSFFVKPQDIASFNAKSAKFFRTFHDCVNFTEANFSASFKYLNRKYDVAVPVKNRRTDSYTRSYRDSEGTSVVMGGVAYAFDMASTPSDPQLRQAWVTARDWLRKFEEIYVYVPIGSVDIAASRETVSPTDRTIRTVSSVINSTAEMLDKEYAKKYKASFESEVSRASLMSDQARLIADLPWVEACTYNYEGSPVDYDDAYKKRWDKFIRNLTGGSIFLSEAIQYSTGRNANSVTQSVEPSMQLQSYEVYNSNNHLSVPQKALFEVDHVFVETDRESRVASNRTHTAPAIIRHNVLNNYNYITIVSSSLAAALRDADFKVMKWDELEKPPRKERTYEPVKRTKWESMLAGSFCPDGFWLEGYSAGLPARITLGKSSLCVPAAISETTKKIAYIEAGVGSRYGAVLPIWAGKVIQAARVNVSKFMNHITSVVQRQLGVPVIAASPACVARLDKAGIGVNVFDFYIEKIKELVKVEELTDTMISNTVFSKFLQTKAAIPIPVKELTEYCGNADVAKTVVSALSGKPRNTAASDFVADQLKDVESVAICYSALTGESLADEKAPVRDAIGKAIEFIDNTYPLAAQAIKSGGSTYYCSVDDVIEYVELINKKKKTKNNNK